MDAMSQNTGKGTSSCVAMVSDFFGVPVCAPPSLQKMGRGRRVQRGRVFAAIPSAARSASYVQRDGEVRRACAKPSLPILGHIGRKEGNQIASS